MVYGAYGRSGVYEMQKAMRMVLPESLNIPEKIRIAKKFFVASPFTATFRSNPRFLKAAQEYDDEEFFDTFLHSQVGNLVDNNFTGCCIYGAPNSKVARRLRLGACRVFS